MVSRIKVAGQSYDEISVQRFYVLVNQLPGYGWPIMGDKIVVVKWAITVPKQFLLRFGHILPKERQLLKTDDGRLIGFLMKRTVIPVHLCYAVICLNLHRCKFLLQFHSRNPSLDAKGPGRLCFICRVLVSICHIVIIWRHSTLFQMRPRLDRLTQRSQSNRPRTAGRNPRQ